MVTEQGISRAEVRDDFEQIVADLGYIPSSAEYEKHTEYSIMTLTDRFLEDGYSYYDAVEALGYEPSQSESGLSPDEIEPEWLQNDFERVVEELGHVPSRNEYAEHGHYEMTVFLGLLSDSFLYTDVVENLGYSPGEIASSSPTRRTLSSTEVREDFERVAEELGHVPTSTEYDEHGEYSHGTVSNKFGSEESSSYVEAVRDIGFEIQHGLRSEEVREDFEQVAEELGRAPTQSEYLQCGEYSNATVARHFGDGSYPAAVQALGYDVPDHGGGRSKVDPADAKADFERVVEELGHVPTAREYREHGRYAGSTLARKFCDNGSHLYYDGVKALGYEPPEHGRGRPSVEPKEVREDFERVVEELGQVPTIEEYSEHGEHHYTLLGKKFAAEGSRSYTAAVKELGYAPRHAGHPAVSADEVREDFERVVEELGRVPSSQEYAVYGEYSSATFGKKLTEGDSKAYNDAVKALGYEPRNPSRGPVSESEVKADFKRVVDELSHIPSSSEYNQHGEYSATSVLNRFSDDGTYKSAVENMGYTPLP